MNSLPEFIRLTGLKLHGFVTNVTDWVGHIGLPAQMTFVDHQICTRDRRPAWVRRRDV
jgi:hypothetical protein